MRARGSACGVASACGRRTPRRESGWGWSVGPYRYASAREFFQAASAAARDAERASRQLDELESDAESLCSSGFEPRVRSTGDPDRMGARVAHRMDRRDMLEARIADDYALIDAACEVLYGEDNRSGLWALVGWPADAIYHHYLALRTWEDTADLVCYSEPHVRREVAVALDVADANGMMWTKLGMGFAEDTIAHHRR